MSMWLENTKPLLQQRDHVPFLSDFHHPGISLLLAGHLLQYPRMSASVRLPVRHTRLDIFIDISTDDASPPACNYYFMNSSVDVYENTILQIVFDLLVNSKPPL
jgi:hypothetical protein